MLIFFLLYYTYVCISYYLSIYFYTYMYLICTLLYIYHPLVPCVGNDMSKRVQELAALEGCKTVLVSAQVESELCGLSAEDRAEFLAALDVTGN